MKLLKETGVASTYSDDLTVVKKFSKKHGKTLGQEWFDNYFELSQYMDFVPNILSYTPYEEIVMERYPGKSMREWIEDQHDLALKTDDASYWGKSILQCIKIVSNINSAFINYSAHKGQLIKHIDITVDNILMKHPGNYCLIDLDSIIFDWAGSRVEPYAHIWLNDLYVQYMISDFRWNSAARKYNETRLE